MLIEDIDALTKEKLSGLNSDLVILVGKNNSGKSRIIKKWRDLFGDEADYITPSRFNINEGNFADPEQESKNQIVVRRQSHHGPNAKISELPQPNPYLELINLSDKDLYALEEWHNKYFDKLEICLKNSDKRFSGAKISIGEKEAHLAGSGSRAVLSLLSRLLNSNLELIFIDEPEIGLEPRIQKRLFKLIKKVSKGEDELKKKKIILVTHSNLFLDKENITNNWIVEKADDGKIYIEQIKAESEILSLSFNLLGASPSDIFLPENILIVEGLSDQIFIKKIVEISYPNSKISIHFADGINKIDYAIPAIDQMLKSLSHLSLYKEKICVLVDKTDQEKLLDDWQNWINDERKERVIHLNRNGIEFFYPKTILISLTGISEDLMEIETEKFINETKNEKRADFGDLKQISKIDLAKKVSENMNERHLIEIDKKITDLIDMCNKLKFGEIICN